MEELLKIVQTSEEYCNELRQLKEQFIQDLRAKLGGQKPTKADSTSSDILPAATPQQIKKRIKRLSDLNESDGDSLPENKSLGRSARSSNSRPLAAAVTMDAENFDDYIVSQTKNVVPMPAPRSTKTQETEQTEEQLMPPPPVPIAPLQADVTQSIETSFARPQRAAKLKSEKNLKEPKLNNKLRRPSKSDTTTVKLEHEQRPSQFYQVIENVSETNRDSSKSTASVRSEDSVVAILAKAPSVVEINSEDEETTNDKESPRNSVDDGKKRGLRIKIKREKSSLGSTNKKSGDTSQLSSASKASVNTEQTVPIPKVAIKSESDESTLASTVSINTTSTSTNTKRRKKKAAVPKPIKVERFSDIEKPARTRKEQQKQVRTSGGSVYEDAVDHPIVNESTDTPPTRVSTVPPQVAAAAGVNETVNNRTQPDKTANLTVVTGGAPSDATFCANAAQTTFQVDAGQATFVMDTQNANMTVTMDKKSGGTGASVADTTYNVHGNGPDNSTASSQHSMETAKDTTHPQHDSLITEDESFEPEKPKSKLATLPKPGPAATKLGPSKVYKMPTRTNELFNPLVQSPVKKKVEAFENAAIAAHSTEVTSTGRPKRTKENTAPSSLTTPTIGKLASAPALGRFLTPTQSSNLTGTLTKVKKVPNSASKAMAHPKAMTSVKGAGSATSSKPLSRENSAEDFRKGLHNLAEERKKQREQKHLIAAQQREAKERERAERAAKLVKEREEKRLKRQQEAEQKKQALEEIQRNLRQQEEAAKLKAAKLKAEQEREVLQQVKQQNARAAAGKMLPPPPKLQSKYTFDMLHEDDSTDEEEKTSYKRPPPPTWSRSHVRGAAIRMQQYWPTKIIDSFFSVQPMSPDLRSIFPNISAHHLKRNSSVLWTTPPRYSELPKY